ncbi:hypothetical protein [Tenacibaculum discolor]|uniref:hypothetical protein n=1 Tax=Tenacibaculum discolor TaxID=361581 RepID=UPI000F5981C9|nr:hypothetical protein [Tenacibaculum discolor]
MKQNKETLKQFFETGDKPTQQQYSDLIDSYIDAKQPEGEANRRFVIDETGEVSVASELIVPQSDWNQTDITQLDFIKNKPEIGLPVGYYEEGTWTPVVTKGITPCTFNSAICSYVRTGNLVNFSITISELNTPTGNLNIGITLPPSLPLGSTNGHTSINVLSVGGGGTISPSTSEIRGVFLTADKVFLRDLKGVTTEVTFQTPGNSFRMGGSYYTNVYTP